MLGIRYSLFGAIFAVAALGGATAPNAAKTGPMDALAGRWSGTGTVTWKNGQQRPYACVVTYYLTEGGAAVKQLLKCQDGQGAGDVKLDLRTAMKVDGDRLSGRWEDRLYSLEGDMTGKVTPTGFEANAVHALFQAKFEIAMTTSCHQSVKIRPSRDIEMITAELKKC